MRRTPRRPSNSSASSKLTTTASAKVAETPRLLMSGVLNWKTPAADSFILENRKFFETDEERFDRLQTERAAKYPRATTGQDMVEGSAAHGEQSLETPSHSHPDHDQHDEATGYQPPHNRCCKCQVPYFPPRPIQKVKPKLQGLWALPSHPKDEERSPLAFHTRTPRWMKTQQDLRENIGPGTYTPRSPDEKKIQTVYSENTAFFTGAPRFAIKRSDDPVSGFDFLPLPDPLKNIKSLPIPRSPRFTEPEVIEIPSEVVGYKDGVEEQIQANPQTVHTMRSQADRFGTLAATLFNVSQAPAMKFSNDLGPGSYDLPDIRSTTGGLMSKLVTK